MILMIWIEFINAFDAHKLFISLTIQIQDFFMFDTNRFFLQKFTQIFDNKLSTIDFITFKDIK
jgi:hypothetical protein